jgi:putative flippase GtrA
MEFNQTKATLLALKFLKFGIVGFSGLLVDFGLTWICKEKLKLQKYLSNSIGFVAAASSNYYLNRIWTFESHNPQIVEQFAKFLMVSLIGLGLNNLLIYILHEQKGYNFYGSKLVAIGFVMLWNFTANYFFTFWIA